MWFAILLACSDVPVAGPGVVVKSTPAPATTDLIAQKRKDDLEAVKDHPLVPLFPKEIGIPPVLKGLKHGMPNPEATALLQSVQDPSVEMMRSDHKGEILVGTSLKEFVGVGVTLHLTPQGLDSFDVSVPAGIGQQIMLARWGEPPTTLRDELGDVDVYLWASHESGMSVQLHKANKGKQVVQFKWVEGIKK